MLRWHRRVARGTSASTRAARWHSFARVLGAFGSSFADHSRRVEPVATLSETPSAPRSLRRRLRRFANHSEFTRRLRARRYERFVALVGLEPDHRIINVGAGAGGALERFNETNQITAVDTVSRASVWLERPNVTALVADGTNLPFGDVSFDVAFSNSVIEHIAPSDQAKLANEIRCVARRYYVQTPYRVFPIEPHFFTPLLHFLPNPWRRKVHHFVKLGGRHGWEQVTLLTARDMRQLFPDGKIHRERFFGVTKSLFAVRR